LDDKLMEWPNERFRLQLSNVQHGASNGLLMNAEVTILDDGDAGTLEFTQATYSVSEASPTVLLTITRLRSVTGVVYANYTTSNQTALSGVNYGATDLRVTLADGQSTAVVSIPLINNLYYEYPNKYFDVTLNSKSFFVKLGQVITTRVVIVDDMDVTIRFSSPTFQFSEGVGNASIEVSRLNGPNTTKTVTVRYSPKIGGTASLLDYNEPAITNKLLVMQGHELRKNFSVPIINDQIYENPNEYFYLQLHNPVNGTVAGFDSLDVTKATIIDDGDAVPSSLRSVTTAALR
jgi:hypothetical protein